MRARPSPNSPQDHSCESPASVPTGTFSAMFRLEHFSDMFRLEHYDDMFRLEHSAVCSNRNIQPLFLARHLNNPPECSDWNIGRVLHTIQLARGNSTLHSKCESHYSANSSGSSTIYGTRHRCCQSEGRRG